MAEAAGCAIGSVYNEFGHFDGLVLTINRETVQRLTEKLRAAADLDARAQLHGLAQGYLAFASENANLLRSLFEHRWRTTSLFLRTSSIWWWRRSFALMYPPLFRLMPRRDPVEVALIA